MNERQESATEKGLKIATLKALGLVILGFVLLIALHFTHTFEVLNGTWVLLLITMALGFIQWLVIITVYWEYDDEEPRKPASAALKIASIIPTVITIAFIVVVLVAKFDFVNTTAANFFLSLAMCCGAMLVGYVLASGIGRIAEHLGWKTPSRKRRKRLSQKEYDRYYQNNTAQNDPNAVVFPDLCGIDDKFAVTPYRPRKQTDVTLKQLCDGFNTYLESHRMYYTLETIRSFIAGMACSRFVILEGLSGTGKTSLPKYFAEYIGCDVCFTSVQASWKDRSDILGYYNDFTQKFKETPFLRSLYSASYTTDEVNLMVLDEMNLSRIEYYFADFLSVLELDPSKWNIELMPESTIGKLPEHLVNGCAVEIPQNTWFVGTANKDDSTFTITDKVYDRAVIIDFAGRNESASDTPPVAPLHIGANALASKFNQAVATSEFNLTREDYERFSALGNFMSEKFDITFGNRVLNQIVRFVPVYVACGSTANKALDIMFARKILRKLDGRFDDSLKGNLTRLETLIRESYGADDFALSMEAIAKLKRKLI